MEKLVSAGGVVYRLVDGRIDTVVCGRREPLRWSLPKGTPDEGETLEQTALREVREETGLEAEIEAPIGNINYWFVSPDNRSHFNKTVYFYLMAYRGGCTDRHDPEFDEVRWLSSDEAMKSLIYANEAKVLGVALDIIKNRVSQ